MPSPLCAVANLLALQATCFLLFACVPAPRVAADFSKFARCPEENVSVDLVQKRPRRYTASGCGRRAEYDCVGPHCESATIIVAKRHSRQFGCRSYDVHVHKLAENTWLAKGCGQSISYQCFREDHNREFFRCIVETTETDLRRPAAK